MRVARSEWGVNQHRDSLALYVGYDSLSSYIAIAENESIGRVKFNALQVRADVLLSVALRFLMRRLLTLPPPRAAIHRK
jgi:hypothetical protein